MLAKGRLLGVQFCAILEDGLYFELARHADRLAMELRRAFETRGYEMLFDSYTNQQYPILPDGLLAQLEEEFALTVWSKVDGGHTAVRVCTSWGHGTPGGPGADPGAGPMGRDITAPRKKKRRQMPMKLYTIAWQNRPLVCLENCPGPADAAAL